MTLAELHAWTDANYADRDGVLYCRRCGQEVNYVTKHAVLRHGDPIEVMPVVHFDLGEEKW